MRNNQIKIKQPGPYAECIQMAQEERCKLAQANAKPIPSVKQLADKLYDDWLGKILRSGDSLLRMYWIKSGGTVPLRAENYHRTPAHY